MPLFKSFGRWLAHLVFQPDRIKRKMLRDYCDDIRDSRILEIGSGRWVDGELAYSVAEFFRENGNDVTLSDVEPEFGHAIVDISKSVPGGYDVIVCFNVLEHVYDFRSAVSNLYEALPTGGKLLLYVPMFYPLHDEPHDFYRYTEHALQKMLGQFATVEISHFGLRQFPVGYIARATR
jgi:SAM-dependent methyltransferase